MDAAPVAICLARGLLLPQRIDGLFNSCCFAHFHGAGEPFDLLYDLGVCDLNGHPDVHMLIDNVALYIPTSNCLQNTQVSQNFFQRGWGAQAVLRLCS